MYSSFIMGFLSMKNLKCFRILPQCRGADAKRTTQRQISGTAQTARERMIAIQWWARTGTLAQRARLFPSCTK